VFDSHATNPYLFKDPSLRHAPDFRSRVAAARGPLVLVVNAKLGLGTVDALIKVAQSKPAPSTRHGRPGSPARLLMELLRLEQGSM